LPTEKVAHEWHKRGREREMAGMGGGGGGVEGGPIRTKRNRGMFAAQGHLYHYEAPRRDGDFWRCVRRKADHCPGSVIVADGEVVREVRPHNHAGSAGHVEAAVATTAAREAAETGQGSVNAVLAGLRNVSDAALVAMPSKASQRRTLFAARRREGEYPEEPVDMHVEIPLRFLFGLFRVFDSYLLFPDLPRILVFADAVQTRYLQTTEVVMSDGTFSIAGPFAQLYTIHGIKRGWSHPCVYAFLPSKTRQCYDRLLGILKELIPNFRPRYWMTDLELAMSGAVATAFVDCETVYCYFHVTQALWRHLQQMGLQKRYGEDAEFSLKVRVVAALAFLLPAEVIAVFEELQEDDYWEAALDDYVAYFQATYLGRPYGRGRRRAPLFAVQSWNVYRRTLDGEARTTNQCEGWHRSFASLVETQAPGFWQVLQGLEKSRQLATSDIRDYDLGADIPDKKNKRYVVSGRRLFNIVTRKAEYLTNTAYLEAVAHNLSF
jgi:hypothetical protein